jgi:acyl-CoA synthetase (AMP-forming)/AMP-acid ligase II
LIGKGLQPGESVILMLPTAEDYFRAFFGVLLAGGIPVPVYPPGRAQQLEEHVRRHGAIADNAHAAIMITVPEAVAFARLAMARAASLRAVVTPDDLKGSAMPSHLPNPAPSDTAFIQYTSGSTGDPKGVVLSHANLLANIRAMGERLEVTPDDVFISWLPLYHDMGLIGAWLGSLTYAMPLVLMAPLSFLARPQRWLWAISNYKRTISGGPNFAYEACQARIRDTELDGCDLSFWRVAFCGAEPINVATLETFMQRFAGIGFARTAMMPVYGLAENSVGLTFPPAGREPLFDRIDAQHLARTGAAIISGADDGILVPSCGYPISGHQVRIVDDGGRELADRRQGRLQFQGPSASIGYLRNAEATKALFDGDWLNSGDLGYTVDGEVYITGRTKDLIIRGGRNIHPAEIEAALSDLEGLRTAGIAVFGSPDPASGTERLIVMAETRRRGDAARTALEGTINARATDIAGAPPDRVLLVAPRTVPKTSSGKIRRGAARQMFESGAIDAGPASLKWQKFRITASVYGAMARRGAHRLGGAAFAIYVGAAILILAPLAWLGVAVLPVESWRWRLVRGTLAALFSIARIKITTKGLSYLPAAGPIILAANHSSYLDGAVLAYALGKPLRFVAKAELSKNPITRIF